MDRGDTGNESYDFSQKGKIVELKAVDGMCNISYRVQAQKREQEITDAPNSHTSQMVRDEYDSSRNKSKSTTELYQNQEHKEVLRKRLNYILNEPCSDSDKKISLLKRLVDLKTELECRLKEISQLKHEVSEISQVIGRAQSLLPQENLKMQDDTGILCKVESKSHLPL